ncbi:protein DpdH [Crocosphaera sp. XPORK-15E]|uniref:protein DpdH n=1 Tax=Crocosphaera sp. XPORK-15E TaxID=3110247 RepID=UPI002B2040CF|nr:protein DpdH [Crocosphaera sp. XPORK-15E]MEA5536678.1 protein DpdH [Crocosphaera sp. XPORK-15E]
MTFQNYVCWKSENIQPILNIEAIQPEDHIFLATHHPLKMKKSESIQGTDEISYTEEDCLRDFLQPDDFAFVPILGQSGTGKSHLIRWLAANIESTEKRKVLLIPKLGTNLKDIIGMILNLPELEGEKFDEYRKRLIKSSSSLTETEARKQLLNQLAVAVGDNERRDHNKLTEEEQYLVESLDSLLYDPYFRKEYWLKDEGIIHRLVTHTLGYQNTIENVEKRREFTLEDLPLSIVGLQKAGEQATDFYRFLIGDEDVQKDTVSWLNKHLDEAITKVLNLGKEDLQILMREVRETLAHKEVELVLLIEDFAKLQGIDREVLEAVLARPQQAGSQPLCAIRTALACTTGYFNGLIQSFDTIQQRVTFKVSLDVGEISDHSLVTEADIQQMVARYLNAVRHQNSDLKQWLEDYKNDENNSQPPNFCEDCQHRQDCHKGFGDINGMGLYPFTPIALQQMRKRVNPDHFNPRILLKDVLKYTLENSVENIENGSFPSTSIREHFGKMRLSAITQSDIKSKDTKHSQRRQTLIDLWTDSDKICDLSPEIHTAFNLPPLGVEVIETNITPVVKETTGTYEVSPNTSNDSKIPDKLAEKLNILDNWNNQAILPQDVEKDIREFVYPAVCEHIEWDTEMLIKGNFASNSSVFKQRNVQVYSPRMRGEGANHAGIILQLPLKPDDEKPDDEKPDDENEFRETAIAFQGMLLYSYYKHWNFEDGDRYFRTYAKHLDRWSNYILEQIRCRPRISGELWNPVPATVELLEIASQMSGLPNTSIEASINSLFLEIPELDDNNRSSSWKALYKVFQTNKNKLLDILKSYIGCTKGSRFNFQIIDTVQIIEPLKTVRKTGNPQCDVPDDLNKEYEVIQKVRNKVDELLMKAIEEETDRQLSTYEKLVAEFGENVNKKEVVYSIKEAIDQAREAGVFGQKSAEKLGELVVNFNKTRLTNYLELMEKVKNEKELSTTSSNKLLSLLSENNTKIITVSSEFLEESNKFLDSSLNSVQDHIHQLTSEENGESIETITQSIEKNLLELQDLLIEIKDF